MIPINTSFKNSPSNNLTQSSLAKSNLAKSATLKFLALSVSLLVTSNTLAAISKNKTEVDQEKNQVAQLENRVAELEAMVLAMQKHMGKSTAQVKSNALQSSKEIHNQSSQPKPFKIKNNQTKFDGIKLKGYASAVYEQYDFYKNKQTTTPVKRDRMDIERAIVELIAPLPKDMKFVAEIEFEHGGTGAAIEYEPEEAGEFEQEVEKGGEVVIEQAFVGIPVTDNIKAAVGHFVIPFGRLNYKHRPDHYPTVRRPLAETTFLPSTWHETGVKFSGNFGKVKLGGAITNGLDSSGFNSSNFIKDGTNKKFEQISADSLAYMARADYKDNFSDLLGNSSINAGASVYVTEAGNNRPVQNQAVESDVLLWEAYAGADVFQNSLLPISLSGGVIRGEINNAKAVNRANLQTFNPGGIGVSKTPVAREAGAEYLQVIGKLPMHLILNEPGFLQDVSAFARVEHVDTMMSVSDNVTKNNRFDIDAITLGLNVKPSDQLIFKGQWQQIKNGIEQKSNLFSLGIGTVF